MYTYIILLIIFIIILSNDIYILTYLKIRSKGLVRYDACIVWDCTKDFTSFNDLVMPVV